MVLTQHRLSLLRTSTITIAKRIPGITQEMAKGAMEVNTKYIEKDGLILLKVH